MDATLAPAVDEHRRPRWYGGTWQSHGSVLRYGENPHQQAALYSDDVGVARSAQAEQLHGKEMSLQQLHRRRRRVARHSTTRDLRGDHQTRQPVRHRDLGGVGGRCAPQGHECDPLSAFGGVHRHQHHGQRRDGRDRRRHLHRGDHRPAFEAGAVILARKKNIRVLVAPEPQPGGPGSARSAAACWSDPRRTRCRRRRPDQLDAGHRRRGSGHPVRSGVRLAGIAAGEIQRHRGGPRRRDGGRRNGSGQPRSDAARLAVRAGRCGAGPRCGGGIGRSSFPDGLETLTAAGESHCPVWFGSRRPSPTRRPGPESPST